MGWTSSTGVIQHIHRNVLLYALSPRSRLSGATEIRKDKPMPRFERSKSSHHTYMSLWQVYLDNFDGLEVATKDSLVEGSVSSDLALAKEIYNALSIPMNLEKEENRVLNTSSLGTKVRGASGILETPGDAMLNLICFTPFTLGREKVSLHHMQVLAGRWVRLMLHRRPLFSSFEE
eukprot:9888254-Karenia_brevis.AAC.1